VFVVCCDVVEDCCGFIGYYEFYEECVFDEYYDVDDVEYCLYWGVEYDVELMFYDSDFF